MGLFGPQLALTCGAAGRAWGGGARGWSRRARVESQPSSAAPDPGVYAAASPRREIVLLPPPPSLCVSLPISRSRGGSSILRPSPLPRASSTPPSARPAPRSPAGAGEAPWGGGGFAREPAGFQSSGLAAACLLLLLRLSNSSPVATGVCLSVCASFFFFFIALCFCNPEAKAGEGG